MNSSNNSGAGSKRRFPKRKFCKFCAEKIDIDYKDHKMLRNYITERSKILPGRVTGTCAIHQRRLAVAIKSARVLALLPFAIENK